ncbi:uncharacterized protein LOC107267567 isoform X2 [Cephus cinctus]|uniref:Uncharacterized protein LOC107267567 isoform X2 n=1 Tax=Cephus cinctus TaxID=211228 RepID=A0AAJ7W1L8_CEPCN|nr:uncharacterized protein LOC107267567 isoform X2 [Cephus cinctus]
MHVACKCLNVFIKCRDNELRRVNLEDLELTALERADTFFREVSPDEIEKLRASPDYSAVFKIVINHSALADVDLLQASTKFSVSQLSNSQQLALGSLQQQLEEAVQREAAAVEEKIRAFTAKQYQLLEQFRERAHTEHRLLARLICNNENSAKSTNDLETPPATPEGFKETVTSSMGNTINNTRAHLVSNDTKFITGANIRHQAATKHPASLHINGSIDRREPLKVFSREPSSLDAEALFPLEGMDDTLPCEQLHQSDEESDTDDSGHDEGIHIPRGQRGGHPTLAKSLPVSVPAFPSYVRRNMQDQDDDRLSRDPLDPHNIRASIKALAKSVHGDTVFGDLPRPRFSTQI